MLFDGRNVSSFRTLKNSTFYKNIVFDDTCVGNNIWHTGNSYFNWEVTNTTVIISDFLTIFLILIVILQFTTILRSLVDWLINYYLSI